MAGLAMVPTMVVFNQDVRPVVVRVAVGLEQGQMVNIKAQEPI